MTEEQLKAFLEAVNADTDLQEKLKAAENADAVVSIAKEAGYSINHSELLKAQDAGPEVSEEDLESMAAGCAFISQVFHGWGDSVLWCSGHPNCYHGHS